jgi:hypothetical protein
MKHLLKLIVFYLFAIFSIMMLFSELDKIRKKTNEKRQIQMQMETFCLSLEEDYEKCKLQEIE